MRDDDVDFEVHCDDPGCDLGKAVYDCPCCGKTNFEYGDLWWDGYSGEKSVIDTVCEHCGSALVAARDADGCYRIMRRP
jgi:hypothetical protein